MSRGFCAGRFVEPRPALLANLADRFHFAKAVRHSLGDPPLDAQAFGEVARVKWLGQRAGEQAA